MSENECMFCRIARGEIPSKKVYEDNKILAFLDINPRNPGHMLVIPKKHFTTVFDMSESEAGELFAKVRKVAGMVNEGTKAQGVSIANSNGQAAGQAVAHVHFHIIPRFINEAPPGLECMLSPKRFDEQTLDKIAQVISSARPQAAAKSSSSGIEDEFAKLEKDEDFGF